MRRSDPDKAGCHVDLRADGWGWVLIDGGAGDWLGAQVQWRNQQQALQVIKVIPLPVSTQRRIMPLEKFELRTEFNRSLSLKWNAQSFECRLQKVEKMTYQRDRARSIINQSPQDEGR